MKIRFACPSCEMPGRVANPTSWRCPKCDGLLEIAAPTTSISAEGEKTVHHCTVCGNRELYKKKAFPHWLGLTMLLGACVLFLVLNAYRHQWWAWAVLLGSAVFDGLLYFLVPDAVVCYRCGADYRDLGRCGNKPFELTVHERYRQERIRLLGKDEG